VSCWLFITHALFLWLTPYKFPLKLSFLFSILFDGFFFHFLHLLVGVEYPDAIQSMNPWVKIPEEFYAAYAGDVDGQGTTLSSPSSSSAGQTRPAHVASLMAHGSGRRVGGDASTEPFFDHAMMTNLSEHLGSHAYLRCRVKNLADRVVSLTCFVFDNV